VEGFLRDRLDHREFAADKEFDMIFTGMQSQDRGSGQ
jgi:hypothetical protein